MQIAIDNAKRSFDIDLSAEIKRISEEMNVQENGLPSFWQITKKDKRKARNDKERHERDRKNKEKIRSKINTDLVCPMNYIYNLDLENANFNKNTIPISEFFVAPDEIRVSKRRCKKVEELIQKYSLELINAQNNPSDDTNLLLRDDFDKLIDEIQQCNISQDYTGLFAWLINRAFIMTPNIKSNLNSIESKLNKNKPLLLKVLYSVNKKAFFACFCQKNVPPNKI